MDGLKTSRVLVLDDDIKEAMPFMEALAKRSIGSLYFPGDDESKLPTEDDRLTGIRLAALDLDLGIGGEAGPVIDVLVTTLNSLIHKENGPYLAIAWTSKDDTYFEEFQNRLDDLTCRPVGLIKMQKKDFTDIDEILTKVRVSMEETYPLGLLSYWEGVIHVSSGSVMQVMPVSTDWQEQSRRTLRLILDYAADSDGSPVTRLAALMSTFNALQLDSIESSIGSIGEGDASPLVLPLNDVETSNHLELKAKLNLRLLCTDAAARVAPGNIYRGDEICPSGTSSFPSLDQLLDDMVRSRPRLDEHERQQQLQAEHEKIEGLKAACCIPIAMEVTPLCDYQQGKVRLPRFLCGVAVPYEERHRTKRPEGFLRTDNAPIDFESGDLAGRKMLVWNSRYIVSVPDGEINGEAKLVRLRQAPLIDVQAWLASQLNRPGYLSLTVPW